MEEQKTEYLHIRVTPEFKQKIQEYCEQTGRTITSLVEWLLRKELEKTADK